MNNRSLLFTLVVASIAQALLFDLSMLFGWAWGMQRVILWIALALDVVFVLDFLLRFYGAVLRTEAFSYLFHGRGWIDVLASVVPLMLASGPIALSVLGENALPLSATGLGYILFAAGFLRYLRVVKLFDAVAYPKSPMAHRHMSGTITGASAVVVLLGAIGFVLVMLVAEPLGLAALRSPAMYGLAGLAVGIAALLLYLILLPSLTRRFSRAVVDPIHLMEQGLSRKGYNVQVQIPAAYAQDEVFRLAMLYNETVLPVKDTIDTVGQTGIADFGSGSRPSAQKAQGE
jgi:hypothetical protein